jgi:hypothetical protein
MPRKRNLTCLVQVEDHAPGSCGRGMHQAQFVIVAPAAGQLVQADRERNHARLQLLWLQQ